MVLANLPVLRLRLEKQRAKPAMPYLPAMPLAMIALSEAQVRFARAGFSSVPDGRHCWLRCGAHKGPIVRM